LSSPLAFFFINTLNKKARCRLYPLLSLERDMFASLVSEVEEEGAVNEQE